MPTPVRSPKVVTGDDGVIYVKAGFATEDETWQAGEKMAEISAEIVEDTERLSGNKAFIREDLRSYTWQSHERTYWIIGLLPCC